MNDGTNRVVVRARDIVRRFGPGCERCEASTGPEHATNVCDACGTVTALWKVSFDLHEGEILGVVGESGSGKSTLVQCLYFDQPAGHGVVEIAGIAGNAFELSRYRQRRIRDRATKLLDRTEIPRYYLDALPRTLSGGTQQRIQIAKALANNPPIVFLDEVTSGLDVSVQAKVLDLIKALQDQLSISMIVVSHDMGVIRLLAGRTIVLKNGHVVEQGLTDQILEDPHHAYTQLLVHSTL